jgi:hypothetical protein
MKKREGRRIHLTCLTQASGARSPHGASLAPTQWTAAVTVNCMVAHVSVPLWVLHHVNSNYLFLEFTNFAPTVPSPFQHVVHGVVQKLEYVIYPLLKSLMWFIRQIPYLPL